MTEDSIGSECERLPAWVHNDGEVFAQEQERVFQTFWQLVGHFNEMQEPGSRLCFNLHDQSAIILRVQPPLKGDRYSPDSSASPQARAAGMLTAAAAARAREGWGMKGGRCSQR